MELNLSIFLLLASLTLIFAQPLSNLVDPEKDVNGLQSHFIDNEYDGSLEKRLSSFVRIGKAPRSAFMRIGRPSSFVRIGKSATDTGSDLEEDDPETPEKRPSSFVRIGKGASSFVRIGKSLGDDEKRMSSFVRIGKNLPMEEDKRMSKFVRIGKSDPEKRAFVRIGKIPSSAFVRIGRVPLYDALLRKPSGFFRINRVGKSSFVRIGKRANEK